eukprot:CAMPEP_0174698878 /NCGR_PEP_ID=MMETSP1094-20130205/4344_1 /TAXON_ID=156173 /ORGANISM="Chrysochromulina brevifilum, Strain UTEX LB 985" /LENGTH=53 /DNA_ID=CAMNT_0015896117 /DNA_START=12 /DNA_END=169 /DNA_ORIENTATION=-
MAAPPPFSCGVKTGEARYGETRRGADKHVNRESMRVRSSMGPPARHSSPQQCR